ncbi:MAG: Hsp33 family molecular chaperone HslO [Burkholderiaceae bacterium]|nr:Hsp33 family molecular chaperone HslO [Burkholderiaceae bacterium]MCD8517598.1 Hsp33 family molecular chaperone HslO [Burkholderiaceae bacterium]MCD8537392.1 Hsp33 family molecular chaperone HslO [Burkholderiaceae bacterium]MCD8565550.1 Hsp33 family molecular chaperone HslO [Burkholderiaceae bacterium]
MSKQDCLNKFLLQDRSARVISVQLDSVWQTAQANQPGSEAIRSLLGELMAAAVMLSANLKFDGSLLLQLQGNGVVKLIVVECRQDLSIRATIKLNHEPHANESGLQALLNADGQGRFSVILNPPRDTPGRQPYQGIVPLTSNTVAEVLQDYMLQSEQLQTRIWLATSDKRLGGLLLQRMPHDGGHTTASAESHSDSWGHANALCDTIDSNELVQLDSDTLLHRLFWETPVIGLESASVTWRCGCNRERVAAMLRSLGKQEVEDIVAEQGQVEVTCEFCATPYRFDAVDAEALFKAVSAHNTDQLH